MEAVDTCHSVGLAVVATVFDMGINNQGNYTAEGF